MIRTLAIIAWLFILPASAVSLDEANRTFDTGDFEAAARAYESLLETHGPSPTLLYNLGNARQKLGETGPAILAYERARLLNPRDPDLLSNLALARKEAALFEQLTVDPRLDAVLQKCSRNEWSWLLAGSAIFLGVLSVARGAFPARRPWVKPATIASASIAAIIVSISATALYLRRAEGDRGVIITTEAAVRLSPFDTAETVGSPSPGRIVRMGQSNGGFLRIQVPGTDLEGWISSDQVAPIEPRPANEAAAQANEPSS